MEDKSVNTVSLFTHFNCCSAGSNIILTNSYNLSQNATHTNYSLLWPLFSDRRRSILTRAVFRSLWKNDTGWSWYSDTTSDMTARDVESLILFAAGARKKPRQRGGGCFSRPEVCLSQRLLPRHVDHFHPPCVLPPCLILSPTKSSTYHKHLNSWTNMWPSETPPRRSNLLSEKFEEHTRWRRWW